MPKRTVDITVSRLKDGMVYIVTEEKTTEKLRRVHARTLHRHIKEIPNRLKRQGGVK